MGKTGRKKITIDEALLRDLYIIEQLTCADIGIKLGVSEDKIHRSLREIESKTGKKVLRDRNDIMYVLGRIGRSRGEYK